jgi:hypothetical protein
MGANSSTARGRSPPVWAKAIGHWVIHSKTANSKDRPGINCMLLNQRKKKAVNLWGFRQLWDE